MLKYEALLYLFDTLPMFSMMRGLPFTLIDRSLAVAQGWQNEYSQENEDAMERGLINNR